MKSKDTFTLWAHQDKASGEITWVGQPTGLRRDLRSQKLPDERIVKLECRIVPRKSKPKINPAETHRRAVEWHGLTDADLRLRLGELTAQEIRTVRAVLNAIVAEENTN